MKSLPYFFVSAILLLVLASCGPAACDASTVCGTVTDSSGRSIANLSVDLMGCDQAECEAPVVMYTTTTDSKGFYLIPVSELIVDGSARSLTVTLNDATCETQGMPFTMHGPFLVMVADNNALAMLTSAEIEQIEQAQMDQGYRADLDFPCTP